jgi:sensor histidine kinase YesM
LTGIAIVRALQQYYIIDITTKKIQLSLWWHIPFNLFLWWSWFLFLPVIYWITTALSFRTRKLYYWLLLYILLPLGVIFLRQFVATVITYLVQHDREFLVLLMKRTLQNGWIWLDFVVYVSIAIAIRIIEYQQKNTRDILKYTQTQGRLVQSQLSALSSQIRPHFLFNALSSVSTSIVLKENTEAKRMLALISSFLKTTVEENDQQEIQLCKELSFINQYLQIEKIRFNDKLKIVQEIDPQTLSATVPSFLLLPLVENSIYHAIASSMLEGTIFISTKKDDNQLTIVIEDTGTDSEVASVKKKTKEGIGLKITKDRLQYLYGDQHSLSITRGTLGGWKVIICLPFREQRQFASVSEMYHILPNASSPTGAQHKHQ